MRKNHLSRTTPPSSHPQLFRCMGTPYQSLGQTEAEIIPEAVQGNSLLGHFKTLFRDGVFKKASNHLCCPVLADPRSKCCNVIRPLHPRLGNKLRPLLPACPFVWCVVKVEELTNIIELCLLLLVHSRDKEKVDDQVAIACPSIYSLAVCHSKVDNVANGTGQCKLNGQSVSPMHCIIQKDITHHPM